MSEKINLPELINLLSGKAKISKSEAEAFLKEYFLSMEEGLLQDRLVKIKNLGTFKFTLIKDRESVDVTTGERMIIPSHDKISFTPDKNLAETINEPFALFQIEEITNTEITEADINVITPEPTTDDEDGLSPEEIEASKEEQMKIEDELFHQLDFQTPERKRIRRSRKKLRRRVLLFPSLILILLVCSVLYLKFSPIPEENDLLAFPVQTMEEPIPQKKEIAPEKEKLQEPEERTVVEEEKQQDSKKRTIQRGERLTTIALEEYGNKVFWVYIFEENKAIISNPNRIVVGLELRISPASKYDIDKNNEESIRKAEEIEDQIKIRYK
jgi:Bacterial nucleoid DNA-binding protein